MKSGGFAEQGSKRKKIVPMRVYTFFEKIK